MIGIVLIGHANIATEMRRALEFVVGEQPLIETLDVDGNHHPEELTRLLAARIRACDTGEGVLLLADMFGGTPCNVAIAALDKGRVEVVSGFNLPLLVKASSLRSSIHDLSELAEQVVESGRNYIRIAKQMSRAEP